MTQLEQAPSHATPAFRVRPAQPGDEAGVVDLFRRAFGKAVTAAHWSWKLRGAPEGLHTAWVAEQAGALIGHYAGTPRRFWLGDRQVQAMVSVDGMVHPEHRQRGVLTKMVAACHQHWIEQGVAFTLGLPNDQWRSRKAALGWRSLFPLAWRVYAARPERLLARRAGIPALARLSWLGAAWRGLCRPGQSNDTAVTWESPEGPTESFDQLWSAVRPLVPQSVVRDSAWIEDRYAAAPSRDYRLWLARRAGEPAGYVVYRLRATAHDACAAYIPELFCAPRDPRLLMALVGHATRQLTALGADAILMLAVPGTLLDRCLRRAGYRFTLGAFDVCITPLGLPVLPASFHDPQDWALQGGDFDVV
jgi:predicted N-acetyltransferase YhbS